MSALVGYSLIRASVLEWGVRKNQRKDQTNRKVAIDIERASQLSGSRHGLPSRRSTKPPSQIQPPSFDFSRLIHEASSLSPNVQRGSCGGYQEIEKDQRPKVVEL